MTTAPLPTPAARTASTGIDCRGRKLTLGDDPLLVGIVNVTPDSFFDGGRYTTPADALNRARELVGEGAAIIDFGGQSTRPGHVEVAEADEQSRVLPVVTEAVAELPVPVSIDTYRASVARACLEAGAHVLNDVHGFQGDPALPDIAAAAGCAVILIHQEPGFQSGAGDPLARILRFLERSLHLARKAGIPDDRIILDPGIGFQKTQEQNLAILGRLAELRVLGRPVLLGASRKSVISHVLDLPPGERLEGTLALTALAAWQGIDLIRVHDVRANLRAARMAAALRRAAAP